MSQTRRLPRVALMFSGGTIDSLGVDRLDLAWYPDAGQRLVPGELLARIPEARALADLTDIPMRRLSSAGVTVRDWLHLAATIQTQLETFDGLVLTHGTNTLEETAYFLHLVLKTERPVVVCGAMRPASAISGDGELNLLNAIRVAANPDSRGQGVLVVLNDTIFSAREVTKTATYRVQTFQGRDVGPLGYADADGCVVYYQGPMRRHTAGSAFDIRLLGDDLPRVDVVVSYVGADGALIEAAVAAGARGIVSAGTGAGRPTPAEDRALDAARAAGVVVCQSSRVGSGRVARSPLLKKRGFVTADSLQPWKARILLALALTQTDDPEHIQSFFESH
jgi:L-asparaginase